MTSGGGNFDEASDLLDRAQETPDDTVVAAAVDAWSRLAASYPDDADTLRSYGLALDARYEFGGDPDDLDTSIEIFRTALGRAGDADDRHRLQVLIGMGFVSRAQLTGTPADWDRAVAELRTAASEALDGGLTAGMLGGALLMRTDRVGTDLASLNEAVDWFQRAVQAGSADGWLRVGLAEGLWRRYEFAGDPSDVDAAISAAREALGEDPSAVGGAWGVLGLALQSRFERTSDRADLEAAVEALRISLDGDPEDAGRLSDLGQARMARYVATGDPADLNAAVSLTSRALEVSETGPAEVTSRANRRSNLAAALILRHTVVGRPQDRENAIALLRRSIADRPPGHPANVTDLANLGSALLLAYQESGDPRRLEEALAVGASAMTVPSSPVEMGSLAANLSTMRQAAFVTTSSDDDLDDAVGRAREALAAVPDRHYQRARLWYALGLSLLTRYERRGSVADLDEAVQAGRSAVGATWPGHAMRPLALSALGSALLVRGTGLGIGADLDEAVVASRGAVTQSPATALDLGVYRGQLAATLLARNTAHDLDEAIDVLRTATASNRLLFNQPILLTRLSTALEGRARRTDSLADLDEAAAALDDALRLTPADHRYRALVHSVRSDVAARRYALTETRAELDRAIELARDAAGTARADDPYRARYLAELAVLLREREEPTDLDEARDAYLEAAAIPTATPALRVRGARHGGLMLAATDPARAAEFLEQAVRLLPEAVPRRLARSDQLTAIDRYPGLAGDAAALVLADPTRPGAERAARALTLLEAGRAVLLSQALDVRTDLDELRQAAPALATRFGELRERLDAVQHEPMSTGDGASASAADSRQELVERYADVMTRIRATPGFADFGLPPPVEKLLAEASEGPIVTFNVGGSRSDALIATPDGVRVVALPDLSQDEAINQVNRFRDALRLDDQSRLGEILEWLWDVAVGPVLEVIDAPRVWWATGGLLALLPVHAAGRADGSVSALDLVVSSYTPTIRALAHARRLAARRTGPAGRSLVVAMPTTPGLGSVGDLRYAAEEARRVASLLPAPTLLDDGRSATRDAVLDALRTCGIAHFACHGISDSSDPSQSRLLLGDHPLTVADLSAADSGEARLAFLSTCDSALAGRLFDEGIHLASALQLAGFPQVVATLWEVSDRVAARLAEHFYQELPGRGGAHALHTAVTALRRRYPATPSLWASYVHAGV
ncbi:CHAT domain-containing protein [Cryptosporangium phraense]|uniref:CHAT domain-containing protein n=1 Tax=Cryptosporangium phraense TaxID=2593070 RepID=A0A545AWA1_9ACTN|nr:CHAT domain-containing protein [Cryptosporangium phraense]TQS45600.1 CHAT domain-containing protein [Cryptosporangium phraense]